MRAMDGWKRVNGIDKQKKKGLTADEVSEMKQELQILKRMERKHG